MMNTPNYLATATKIVEVWAEEKGAILHETFISKVNEAQYADENVIKLVAAQDALKEVAIEVLPIGRRVPSLAYVENYISTFTSAETKKIIDQLEHDCDLGKRLVRQTVTDILNSVELCDTREEVMEILEVYGVADYQGKIIHPTK